MSRGDQAHFNAFRAHFEDLFRRYGQVHVLNLLSPSEKEREMLVSYKKHIDQLSLPDLYYTSFDFHDYLGKSGTKFNLIGPALLDKIQNNFLKFGIYSNEGNRTQQGIFRVNCLDCLDR